MKTILNIFTNGFEDTWHSVEMSAFLSKRLQASVRLIGVIEPNDPEHPVEYFFSKAITFFKENDIEFDLELEYGTVEQIAKTRKDLIEPNTGDEEVENIIVLSPFGRSPLKKMWAGKSFRKLMGLFGKPIFYIQEPFKPIKKILVCVGGLGITIASEGLVVGISQPDETELTLLTVVPPIHLDYPEAKTIRDNWMNLADTDTMVGRKLKHGLESAKAIGVKANCKVRHGNVMEEIKAEIATGAYDLVVMGSTYSSTSLRQMYGPNVTADIAESFKVPILTIRKLIDQ